MREEIVKLNSSAYYQDYLKEIWRNRIFPSSIYDRNNNATTTALDIQSRNDRVSKVSKKKEKRFY